MKAIKFEKDYHENERVISCTLSNRTCTATPQKTHTKTSDGYQVIIKRYLSIQLSNYCNHNGVLLFDIFGYCTRFQLLFFLW